MRTKRPIGIGLIVSRPSVTVVAIDLGAFVVRLITIARINWNGIAQNIVLVKPRCSNLRSLQSCECGVLLPHMLAASKHPAVKRGNGRLIKWMVSVLAALVIGKVMWDAVVPAKRLTDPSWQRSSTKKSPDQYLYANEPNVIEVTAAEGFFQTSQKPRIVEFYSPYCVRSFFLKPNTSGLTHVFIAFTGKRFCIQGHCVHFKSRYVKVANEAREKYGSAVEFYGVSCLARHELCVKYEANSYPMVLAMAAGSNEGRQVSQMFFGLAKVEEELKLSGK
jgi:hypothetical protein